MGKKRDEIVDYAKRLRVFANRTRALTIRDDEVEELAVKAFLFGIMGACEAISMRSENELVSPAMGFAAMLASFISMLEGRDE